MAVTDQDHDQDNFSSISWTEHADDPTADPIPSAGQRDQHSGEASGAGPRRRDHDPHGLGSEKLECTVGSPLKENDGSKDAFISYLITTHVSVILYVEFLPMACLSQPLSVSRSQLLLDV